MKFYFNLPLISLEFSTYFPQQFSLTNQLFAERILKFLLCPMHFKLQDKLNNLGATHSRTVSCLSFYPLIPFLFATSARPQIRGKLLPLLLLLLLILCLLLLHQARTRASCAAVPHATHTHTQTDGGSGVPQNYTRVARIHFGKLSVYQAASHLPAFLLLCSLSQSILNSVPLPLPLPLYRLSAVDCGRFIFTQNGNALQKHTHSHIQAA